MELAEDGADDGEAGEDRGGEEVVASYADVEGSWSERASVSLIFLFSI